MSYSLFFFLIAFLAVVSCQWMTVPVGKFVNNVPQTSNTSPCGSGNYSVSTDVQLGIAFQITWNTANTNGNNEQAYISLLYNDEQYYMSLTNTTFNNGQSYIRIPKYITPGAYKVQWMFRTDYTCAQIQVINATINEYLLIPAVISIGVLKVDDYDYYEFDMPTNTDFLYIEATAPVGSENPNALMTVAVKEGLVNLPTLAAFDYEENSAVNESLSFSTCNDDNTVNYMIGVYGGSGASGNYTLKATAYSPLINFGSQLQIPAHSGDRYYKTDSYSTFGEPRRVAVRTTLSIFNPNQGSYFEIILATDCNLGNNQVQGKTYGNDVACVDLGSKAGDKYIKVPPIDSSYTIGTESGTCSTVGAAGTLHVSLVLLFFASLVTLL